MPVIFRFQNLKFFFYSNEGDPLEPPHIHVRNSEGEAKFWITPSVQLARNDGFDAKTLKIAMSVIQENKPLMEKAWYDYFS